MKKQIPGLNGGRRGGRRDDDDGTSGDDLWARARAAIVAHWPSGSSERWVLYLDPLLHGAGDETPAGVLNTTALVGFVDEQPGANWHHACHYELWGPDTNAVHSRPASQPPLAMAVPSSWRVAWRPSGAKDWQLLPFAPTTDKQTANQVI